MSIQGVTANTYPYVPNTQSSTSSFGSDFKDLASALQSGDLASAQSAFSEIQGLFSNAQSSQGATGSQVGAKQSQLKSDFDALGQALKSGNTSAAQDAFTKLTQDMQASGKAHHHHHHGGQSSVQPTASTGVTSTTAGSGDTSSAASAVNLLL